MFKSLIATCLLTFSCSGGKLQNNTYRNYVDTDNNSSVCVSRELKPKQRVYQDDEYINIRGYWTFLDSFDFDYFYSRHGYLLCDFGEDVAEFYTYNGYVSYYENLNTLEIEFDNTTSNLNVDFGIDDDGESESVIFGGIIFDISNVSDIEVIEDNGFTDVLENLVFHVASDYYLFGEDATVFTTLFTGGGNRYVTYYSGWYYFNNNVNFSFDFKLKGDFIADNRYFSGLDSTGFGISRFDVQTGGYYIDSIDFSETKPSTLGNISFTALMPQSVYLTLNNNGHFTYRSSIPQTTFYEMILSIMDAPIYYLSSLFNFNLFGVDMFVAFTSILTLLVILICIRKAVMG